MTDNNNNRVIKRYKRGLDEVKKDILDCDLCHY